MAVEFQVLGDVEARVGLRRVDLGHARQRCVLAALLVDAGRVVPFDELAYRVWGDSAPRRARDALHSYLSRLRASLSPGDVGIRRHATGYELAVDPMAVDLHRFRRLTAEARAAHEDDVTLRLLEQALDLWQGPPFASLESSWLDDQRGVLEDERLAAELERNDVALRLGRHARLLPELSALSGQYPLDERICGQVMLALYRCGRQADALAHYLRMQHRLADEVGADPSPQLQKIYKRILDADAGPPEPPWEPPRTVSMPPGGPRTVSNLPLRNPHFTGRAGALHEIRRRLQAGEDKLVVQALYGLGGVGKTHLALEFAHRFSADYDLVWWIAADQPVLIPDQLAGLAARLEIEAGPSTDETVSRLLAALRGRNRWLLVLDNAERPEDVTGFLPGGGGHVLVTSRSPGWGALGGRLEVDVLPRAETVALLRGRLPELEDGLADELAAELGDLPLAAAQASAYLEQTGLAPGDYLRRFREHRASLLSRGQVLGYAGTIDSTWALSVERLRAQHPAAVRLLELAAFLAPEPVPLTLFSDQGDLLAEPLRTTTGDRDALLDAVGALVGYSLARRHGHGFQIHRLLQAVVREQLPPEQHEETARQVLALLAAALRGDPENPADWADYALLAPHVLATAPQADRDPAGRRAILDTVRYLHARGNSQAVRDVCTPLVERWRSELGADHPDTLVAASRLLFDLIPVGEVEAARRLGEDTLQRCRTVLGPDHATTLGAAAGLTLALAQLGEAPSARVLGEDTLPRCRRTLGPDHPITLMAAATLIVAQAIAGDVESARVLGQDTLPRCRRVLGPDHASTLGAATALTLALGQLGQAGAARELGEDTLARCRRVLGPDHATALGAAAVLMGALLQGGAAQAARDLGEDTLPRCRRALGPDGGATLWAAVAQTNALVGTGEGEAARILGEDTCRRCRQVHGSEQPITLAAAAALTAAMIAVGDIPSARALGRDMVDTCARVLGRTHRLTVQLERAATAGGHAGHGHGGAGRPEEQESGGTPPTAALPGDAGG